MLAEICKQPRFLEMPFTSQMALDNAHAHAIASKFIYQHSAMPPCKEMGGKFRWQHISATMQPGQRRFARHHVGRLVEGSDLQHKHNYAIAAGINEEQTAEETEEVA